VFFEGPQIPIESALEVAVHLGSVKLFWRHQFQRLLFFLSFPGSATLPWWATVHVAHLPFTFLLLGNQSHLCVSWRVCAKWTVLQVLCREAITELMEIQDIKFLIIRVAKSFSCSRFFCALAVHAICYYYSKSIPVYFSCVLIFPQAVVHPAPIDVRIKCVNPSVSCQAITGMRHCSRFPTDAFVLLYHVPLWLRNGSSGLMN
jgi:hypothetical protein